MARLQNMGVGGGNVVQVKEDPVLASAKYAGKLKSSSNFSRAWFEYASSILGGAARMVR